MNETNPDKELVINEFVKRLQGTINSKNLKQYVDAFLKYALYVLYVAFLPILLTRFILIYLCFSIIFI